MHSQKLVITLLMQRTDYGGLVLRSLMI